jgi:hypothetical protein
MKPRPNLLALALFVCAVTGCVHTRIEVEGVGSIETTRVVYRTDVGVKLPTTRGAVEIGYGSSAQAAELLEATAKALRAAP